MKKFFSNGNLNMTQEPWACRKSIEHESQGFYICGFRINKANNLIFGFHLKNENSICPTSGQCLAHVQPYFKKNAAAAVYL